MITGSSPGERSSITNSPVASASNKRENKEIDANQLNVPTTGTPSKPSRSKSVDISLSELKLDEATISIDMKNNEIIITPTGSKKFDDHVHFNAIDEKLDIGDKISRTVDNFQDASLSNYRSDIDIKDDSSKLTIKGPGSYIKKLIQQFSEGPFEVEEPKAETAKTVSKPSMKDKADAICKKCFHYKGRINK